MDPNLPLPSNRSFGWTFAGILFIAGTYQLWQDAAAPPWLLALAGALAAVTLLKDAWLAPLNRAWMKLGEWLGRLVSPVILALLFFGLFTPTGLVMRLFGRDAMARGFEPRRRSYWIERDPPGPPEGSFGNMF